MKMAEKECDVEFLGQMVESMADAVEKLEEAESGNKIEEFNKIRNFILELQRKIGEICND